MVVVVGVKVCLVARVICKSYSPGARTYYVLAEV